MRKVFAVGVGLTKVDEHWDKGLESLMADAAINALRDAGVSVVDSIYVGNSYGEVLQYQAQLGSIVAEELGLSGRPAVRVEGACASGALAFRQAYLEILSGEANSALVIGGEKLSDGLPDEILATVSMSERYDYTGYQGATQHSMAALLYSLYLERYGIPQENIAQFPVIMHENASPSPHAQFPFKISLESVLNSPVVSEPLRRLECTATADGAAAIVLCSEEVLNKLHDVAPVEVAACSIATDYVTPFDREDPLILNSLAIAAERALERAGLKREDIDVLEIHDSYSIMAALSLESSGFSPKGKAGSLAKDGYFSLNGELPINTFGGLKGRGHPIGATATYQLAELYLQLSGRAGKNQVSGAINGMACSLGGLGGTAVVTIMKGVSKE